MIWCFTEEQLNKALDDYIYKKIGDIGTYQTTDFDSEVTNFLFSDEAKKLRIKAKERE